MISEEKLRILQQKIGEFQKKGGTIDPNIFQSLKSLLLNTKKNINLKNQISFFVNKSKYGSSIHRKLEDALRFYNEIKKDKNFSSDDYRDIARLFGYIARISKVYESISTNKGTSDERRKTSDRGKKKHKQSLAKDSNTSPWREQLSEIKKKLY